MKHPSNEDGRRDGRPDAPHGVLSDGQGSLADGLKDPLLDPFLSRADFEAALPLYVGGELDSVECVRVDSWLNEHPEDRDLLEAASASHSLLQDHAASLRSAESPDLWAGIRAELASSGLLATGHRHQSQSIQVHGRRGNRAVRWYERRSLAAAAAILIFGGLSVMLLRSGGGPGSPLNPDPNSGVGTATNGAPGLVADADPSLDPSLSPSLGGGVFTGTEVAPAGARLAGTKRGVRLRQVTGPSDHILDHAVPVRLEQAQFPDPFAGVRSGNQVQLTGSR